MTATNREYRVMHPRVPADLHARLTTYADRTHRSLTNAVVHLLTVALAREEVDERV